jgi:chorismate mutase
MTTRGIRGAIDVEVDEPEAILEATRTLLEAMVESNPTLKAQDLASVIFTVTADLSSSYPAKAARQLGWTEVPLLCAREIPVPGGLPRIVRVLAHWNTDLPQESIQHVYLGEAAKLRPDQKRS